MKANRHVSTCVLAAAIMTTTFAHSPRVLAQPAATQLSTAGKNSKWSVQVKMVDPGDVNISASFQIAIYESLLDELSKTKRFKQVFRDGERTSSDVPDLLIVRTTVEKYTAGSETQRAVTTVSGATKLTVRSQLCTHDGQIVFERTVRGEVLLMGSNLRATHNLARNVAKTINQSTLPAPSSSALAQNSQL
jgi:hypothetical protein